MEKTCTGKVCIVTGANSGIGYHTAKGLAEKGATVVMVVRNMDKGEAAMAQIKEATGSASIYLMHCDVSDMDSVDKLRRRSPSVSCASTCSSTTLALRSASGR